MMAASKPMMLWSDVPNVKPVRRARCTSPPVDQPLLLNVMRRRHYDLVRGRYTPAGYRDDQGQPIVGRVLQWRLVGAR